MDKIISINGESRLARLHSEIIYSDVPEADGDLTCQSGARWEDINETLKQKGIPLFFPVSTAASRYFAFQCTDECARS